MLLDTAIISNGCSREICCCRAVIFDLCVASIAIGELISCTVSQLPFNETSLPTRYRSNYDIII
jgi:hypothetical protein